MPGRFPKIFWKKVLTFSPIDSIIILKKRKGSKKMKQELYRMYVELGNMALEIEDNNRFQKIMKQREELFKLIEML